MGELQSHFGRGGGKKIPSLTPRMEPYNPNRPAHSLVAVLTDISRLMTFSRTGENFPKYRGHTHTYSLIWERGATGGRHLNLDRYEFTYWTSGGPFWTS